MSDDHPKSRPTAAPWIVVVLMLLPVAYALSVGPARVLVNSGVISGDTYRLLYVPIALAYDQCRPIRQPIDWYIGLWQ